jgi:hypothetical protein
MSHLGIAGEPSRPKLAAVGIAGVNTSRVLDSAHGAAAVGIAGNLPAGRYTTGLPLLGAGSGGDQSLGDRAQREAHRAGVWFLDYTYIVCTAPRGRLVWRQGREAVFGRAARTLPLYLDSTGFRRMMGTAPRWASSIARYVEAIDLTDPDAFMSFDNPLDQAESLAGQAHLERIYGDDPRLWPVWSVRWNWSSNPSYRLHDLPGWGKGVLHHLVPRAVEQTLPGAGVLEQWARLAIANAVATARDPAFQAMAGRYQQIAIGGMVKGPCPRVVRHLYFLALAALYPDHRWWGLGQANYATANGLARVGLLDRVSCDGSWWLADALCHKIAYVHNGLIVTVNLGGAGRETFLTTGERMASLLRSLLSLWAGLITWPDAPTLPFDFRDLAQLTELQQVYQAAQLEFNL